jgi:hypothetical protein
MSPVGNPAATHAVTNVAGVAALVSIVLATPWIRALLSSTSLTSPGVPLSPPPLLHPLQLPSRPSMPWQKLQTPLLLLLLPRSLATFLLLPPPVMLLLLGGFSLVGLRVSA